MSAESYQEIRRKEPTKHSDAKKNGIGELCNGFGSGLMLSGIENFVW